MIRAQIAGVGGYLPDRVITNDELATFVDTSDEWISKRTGIKQRHIAAEGQFTSDLAKRAGTQALENAQVDVGEVDLVIVATTTPDNTFPATAARVQALLGVTNGPAFDVQAVCSGFVYALTMADNMIRLGQAKTALVIGAEVYSRILDWEDRGTCVLFGDGAGAVVLKAQETAGLNSDRGVLSTHLAADGTRYHDLYVDGGPSSTATTGHVRMQGQEVFRFAVNSMSAAVKTVLADSDLTLDDLNWLVPHQANKRIIAKVGDALGIDDEKVIVTVQNQANTSAATIPLALHHGFERQLFQPGDVVALTAMGGGFAWGAAVLRW